MIYPTILIMLLALSLAKRRSTKRFPGGYIKGKMDISLALTTLGANTLVSQDVADTVEAVTWVSSIKVTASLSNVTPVVNAGPVLFGVAHSDYTDAEIEAWIEQATNWNLSDLTSQEVGKRKIRQIGIISAADAVGETSNFNQGRSTRTKVGWELGIGTTLNVWAYNTGIAAFSTSVPQFEMNGHANLWRR